MCLRRYRCTFDHDHFRQLVIVFVCARAESVMAAVRHSQIFTSQRELTGFGWQELLPLSLAEREMDMLIHKLQHASLESESTSPGVVFVLFVVANYAVRRRCSSERCCFARCERRAQSFAGSRCPCVCVCAVMLYGVHSLQDQHLPWPEWETVIAKPRWPELFNRSRSVAFRRLILMLRLSSLSPFRVFSDLHAGPGPRPSEEAATAAQVCVILAFSLHRPACTYVYRRSLLSMC